MARSNPRRISSSISASRTWSVTQRNPNWRRSRCRRMRSAAAERVAGAIAGGLVVISVLDLSVPPANCRQNAIHVLAVFGVVLWQDREQLLRGAVPDVRGAILLRVDQ